MLLRADTITGCISASFRLCPRRPDRHCCIWRRVECCSPLSRRLCDNVVSGLMENVENFAIAF